MTAVFNFRGSRVATLRTKQRFIIPAAFRQNLGNRVYMYADAGELTIMPAATFQAVRANIAEKTPRIWGKRHILDDFLPRCHEVDVASSGRVMIPAVERAKLGFERGQKLMVVGRGSFLEISKVS